MVYGIWYEVCMWYVLYMVHIGSMYGVIWYMWCMVCGMLDVVCVACGTGAYVRCGINVLCVQWVILCVVLGAMCGDYVVGVMCGAWYVWCGVVYVTVWCV